jgi:hypothetical protein
MRKLLLGMSLLVAGLGLVSGIGEGAPVKHSLRLLFVGHPDDGRAKDFVAFLSEHFNQVEAAERAGFDPASAAEADVVLLDWSQHDPRPEKYPSPLGERDKWSKPTVLLGSAGLLLAFPWEVKGGWG